MDGRAKRDVRDRQGIADPSLGVGAGDHHVTDLEAVGHEHVALLAVPIVQEPDPRGAVRVVLDRGDAGGHAHLVALEVDPAVVLLLPSAAMADREATLVVPARTAFLRLEKGLVGLLGRDFLERRASHLPEARRRGLVVTQRHRSDPLEEFDLLAGGQGDDGLAPWRREADDPAPARPAALLLGLGRQDVDRHHRDGLLLVQLLDGRLDLDLVGVLVDGERVLAAARLVDRLLADDGSQDDLGHGQGAHASASLVPPPYTDSIRERAGCSMRTRTALRRSTTFSESARMTSDVGRLRAESSSRSSRAGAMTSTRPVASSARRTPASSFVLMASSPNVSMTFSCSSPSFAVSAPRRARRFILRGRRCSYERGCGPKTVPPPR